MKEVVSSGPTPSLIYTTQYYGRPEPGNRQATARTICWSPRSPSMKMLENLRYYPPYSILYRISGPVLIMHWQHMHQKFPAYTYYLYLPPPHSHW